MKPLFILSFSFLFLSCNYHKITLEGIRYTPEYFRNDMVWGENEAAIKTMNLYLLETGVIDTTSEKPPILTAFIAINDKSIQLNFSGQDATDNEIIETYKGSGYKLVVIVNKKIDSDKTQKAVISITKDEQSAKYELIGKPGLQ